MGCILQQSFLEDLNQYSEKIDPTMNQRLFPTIPQFNLTSNLLFNQRRIVSLLGGVFALAMTSFPVQAAEKVSLAFGQAKISVSVKALETYAKSGTIEPELKSFLLLLNSEDQQQFKNVLLDKHQIDSVMVSQFLNSPTGALFLNKLGDIIESEPDPQNLSTIENGSQAIKIALIRANKDAEGITLLNILRQFPSPEIQLNTEKIFQLREQVNTQVQQTNSVITEIVKLSLEESTLSPSIDFSKKPDLRQTGDFDVTQKTLTLIDPKRDRKLLVDIYIPTPLNTVKRGKSNAIPVIIISHGLAANRTSFGYLGQHLASHGFFVALPQHPGSDTNQLQAWLSGQASDGFQVSEFIDRPLDIQFLLDELERLNTTEFNSQLNLEKVGVAGHSFGAYTALAVGGAELDFNNLKKECTSAFNSVNLAQIFQCRALELPQEKYQFRDERVQAIFIMNPVNNSIFGQQSLSQIQIPVFWKTSGKDNVAPVAWEQVRSYTWLTTPDKYFLLAEGDHHIYLNLTAMNQSVSASLKEIVAPVPEPVNDYIRAFSLAFFEVYIDQDPTYQPYLQAIYAKTISEEAYPLSLVRSLSLDQFFQAVKQVKTQSHSHNH